MATKIQIRRGTAALWTSTNPTLSEGEIGFETDTGKFKVGSKLDNTGTLNDNPVGWTSLPYARSGGTATLTTPLSISADFKNGAVSFNGSTAYTLELPDTINKNAATASALSSNSGSGYKINGTAFTSTANIVAGMAVYSLASRPEATGTATFTKLYASPSAFEPTGTINNGDLWVSW